MRKRRVIEDGIASAIGYDVALAALLLWFAREMNPAGVVPIVGVAIFLAVYATIDLIVFKHSWRSSFWRRRDLPRRSSWISFITLFASIMVGAVVRQSDVANAGLAAFAVGTGILLAGLTASNWFWASASERSTGDIPAR